MKISTEKKVRLIIVVDTVLILFVLFGISHAIRFYPYPYFYCSGIAAVFLIYMFFRIRTNRWIVVNLFSFFAFVFAIEGFAMQLNPVKVAAALNHNSLSYGVKDYFVEDEILGYKPKHSIKTVAKRIVADKIIYEATYTINEKGRRITRYLDKEKYDNSVLFFGCSFTFGEGVNDNESLPFIFQRLFSDKFNVYNFGFHGYGPNQMLAFLEYGNKDEIVEKPEYVFLMTLPAHVERVMNLVSWGKNAPAYRLIDGKIVLMDKKDLTDENQGYKLPWYFSSRILLKSAIIRYLERKDAINKKISQRVVDEYDYDTFIAVVLKSAKIINEEFGIKLDVIFWNNGTERSKYIKEKLLKGESIRLHLVTDAIPDIFENRNKYVIHDKLEGHPNGATYLRIAEYLRDFIRGSSLK